MLLSHPMANTKSAEKRHRQSLKRRERNRAERTLLRTTIRDAQDLADRGDVAGAKKAASLAQKLLAKAAGRNTVHAKNASRRTSRLLGRLSSASQPRA